MNLIFYDFPELNHRHEHREEKPEKIAVVKPLLEKENMKVEYNRILTILECTRINRKSRKTNNFDVIQAVLA